MTIKYRPITEKEFRRKWEHFDGTLDDLNAELQQEHEANLAIAQGLVVAYVAELVLVGNNREAVDLVRQKMREDELFWRHSTFIGDLTSNIMTWCYAVLRSEARRAERSGKEAFEKIAAERAAAEKAQAATEKAVVESLPNYGLF